MICPHCGYVQSDDALTCRRCLAVLEKPARSGAAAVRAPLGEKSAALKSATAKAGATAYPLAVHSGETVPAWRAELSARVRQIKARRTMEAELEAALRDHREASLAPVIDLPSPADERAALRVADSRSPESLPPTDGETPPTDAETPSAAPALDDRADETPENPLVQAALNRVRRATENRRTAPPNGTPRGGTPERSVAPSMRIDMADIAQELESALDALDAPPKAETLTPRRASVSTAIADRSRDEWKAESLPSSPAPDERPYLQERALAGVIDLAVIVCSSAPLWVVAALTDASLQSFQVQTILATAAALIAGMYLFATVATSGQTFGMILTGLRVVSAQGEDHSLTALQALMRAIGHIPSTLPLMAGFLWAAFDKNQRGLHEYISGTQLVRARRMEVQPH
jgi:uncharacterized RDD family membrane protein YckC